jgi:hypothetical protein
LSSFINAPIRNFSFVEKSFAHGFDFSELFLISRGHSSEIFKTFPRNWSKTFLGKFQRKFHGKILDKSTPVESFDLGALAASGTRRTGFESRQGIKGNSSAVVYKMTYLICIVCVLKE